MATTLALVTSSCAGIDSLQDSISQDQPSPSFKQEVLRSHQPAAESALGQTVAAPTPTSELAFADEASGQRPLPSNSDALTSSGANPGLGGRVRSASSKPALPPHLDPERIVVATAAQSFIYELPNTMSPKLGYLRSGGVVRRGVHAVSGSGCDGEFYAVQPYGYICVGSNASIDASHPLLQLLGSRPNRDSVLPYVYGRSRFPAPPFYSRIPTQREQERIEQELHYHKEHHAGSEWQPLGLSSQPEFLQDGAQSLFLNGKKRLKGELTSGRAVVKSAFGLTARFLAHRRLFGLTSNYEVIPLDRLDLVKPSAFQGVVLQGARTLPLAFVRSHQVALFQETPSGLTRHRTLRYREPVLVTGEIVRVLAERYWRTRDGLLLPVTPRVVVIPRRKAAPSWAAPGRTWIEVSILNQTLVAYEGPTPVYATLVSTGEDGLEDHETSTATIQGRFLIHTKHVTSSMGSNTAGDVFDLRDVPYVQYFKNGYALHAAYWHDGFGQPRSHGCINLSPRDARWLFSWSEPRVPQGWHGGMSLLQGTLVNIRP